MDLTRDRFRRGEVIGEPLARLRELIRDKALVREAIARNGPGPSTSAKKAE